MGRFVNTHHSNSLLRCLSSQLSGSECKPSHSWYLSISRSALSSLSLSLSLLLRRFAVLPQSWLVFCNRLNPLLSGEGRYFLLFWLSSLPWQWLCDNPVVAVVICKKKKLLLRFCTGALDDTALSTQPAAEADCWRKNSRKYSSTDWCVN